ncbi:hypothetical protein R6Q57_012136 [Mikania cordata]
MNNYITRLINHIIKDPDELCPIILYIPHYKSSQTLATLCLILLQLINIKFHHPFDLQLSSQSIDERLGGPDHSCSVVCTSSTRANLSDARDRDINRFYEHENECDLHVYTYGSLCFVSYLVSCCSRHTYVCLGAGICILQLC